MIPWWILFVGPLCFLFGWACGWKLGLKRGYIVTRDAALKTFEWRNN